MKVIAELMRVRQEWDPDTGEHFNSVVFVFAGVLVEVVVSEEDLARVVKECERFRGDLPEEQELAQAQVDFAPDDAELEETELEETEFGGDYVPPTPRSPVGFVDEMLVASEPQMSSTKLRKATIAARRKGSPVIQRLDRKHAMRKRAEAAPRRSVQASALGYPVVPQNPTPPPQPDLEDDDDGFAQG